MEIQLTEEVTMETCNSRIKEATDAIEKFYNEDHQLVKKNIKQLAEITDQLESMHRNTTIGSLSGGVIGAAGGITSVVGLILAPFTLGASLIVTGVGVGVAVAGGITGAASNITKITKNNSFREQIKILVDFCDSKLKPVNESLGNIKSTIDQLAARAASPTGAVGAAGEAGAVGAGRAMAGVAQLIRLGPLAAQAAKTAALTGRTIPIISAITLVLDVISIINDAKEVHRIRMRDQGETETESDILKFITQMRELVKVLEENVFEIGKSRDALKIKI